MARVYINRFVRACVLQMGEDGGLNKLLCCIYMLPLDLLSVWCHRKHFYSRLAMPPNTVKYERINMSVSVRKCVHYRVRFVYFARNGRTRGHSTMAMSVQAATCNHRGSIIKHTPVMRMAEFVFFFFLFICKLLFFDFFTVLPLPYFLSPLSFLSLPLVSASIYFQRFNTAL